MKFPTLIEVIAACFLMMVSLYAGSQVGKSECQQEIRK